MATAKPRLRKSRTVSKYFSIHSVRPGKTQTVPRRPAGGAKRAKRICTPSAVLSMPLTAPSGTGLAGIETSFIGPWAETKPRLYQQSAEAQSSAVGRAPIAVGMRHDLRRRDRPFVLMLVLPPRTRRAF